MSVHIVDDEQHGYRPRPPSALRVAAGRPHLHCRASGAAALATYVAVFVNWGT